jgi:hypothetical protein
MSEQSLDSIPVVAESTTFAASFSDVVLDRQSRWKSLKQNPLKEFSQAADIPETVSKNLLGLVIDNLPSYVPEELKTKLREKHPNPIIAVGVLADKRIFHAEPGMVPDFITPENIEGEENQQAYQRGITLLDEIANDTLAQDVLRQLGSKHKWFGPVAAILENRNPIRSGYKNGLKKVEQIFGGKEKFESFRQNLILAMLTGQNDSVNEQLRGLGYDSLDNFAIEMGKSAGYSDVLMDFLGKVGNPRVMYSFAGGLVTSAFPGVINVPLAHTLPASVNMAGIGYNIEQLTTRMDNPAIAGMNLLLLAFNSYWALRPGFAIPNAVIHETCHYLGQDTSHFGLRPVKYSGRNEAEVSTK